MNLLGTVFGLKEFEECQTFKEMFSRPEHFNPSKFTISSGYRNLFSPICVISNMELVEIGIVKHKYSDDFVRDNMGKFSGIVEVFEKFSDGLSGLQKYKNVFLITIMHKKLKEEQPLKVKPRLLLRKGYKLEDLPELGVFASDSPSRPNPIGLTLVRIEKIDGNLLHVYGLDVFNGTPVADIKPFIDSYRVRDKDDTSGEQGNCPEVP